MEGKNIYKEGTQVLLKDQKVTGCIVASHITGNVVEYDITFYRKSDDNWVTVKVPECFVEPIRAKEEECKRPIGFNQ